MPMYEIYDGYDRLLTEAPSMDDAIREIMSEYRGWALEVCRVTDDEERELIAHALVDEDGEDYQSWAPHQRGPIEACWIPRWQEQH